MVYTFRRSIFGIAPNRCSPCRLARPIRMTLQRKEETMGYWKIVGFGILCMIALVLLVVMCAILKESVDSHDAGQGRTEGLAVRSSTALTVSKVSASQ